MFYYVANINRHKLEMKCEKKFWSRKERETNAVISTILEFKMQHDTLVITNVKKYVSIYKITHKEQ